MDIQNPSTLPVFQSFLPQLKKFFPSVLPNRVHHVPVRMYSKPSQRKPAKHKMTSRDSISKRSRIALSKNNHLEAKKRRSGIRKKLQLITVTTPLSSTICLDMKQFVLVPASVYNNKSWNTQIVTKQELPEFQAEPNPTYQYDSQKKEINKKSFARADSLANKFLSCPRKKLSNSQILILGAVEAGVLLSNFAQQLPIKEAHVPDIYFYSTWRYKYISNSGSDSKCHSQKTKRKVGPFQNMNDRSCKDCTRRGCC